MEMSLPPKQQKAALRPGVDPEKAASEFYARLTESVRYLFLAHGAALVFSISALKDLKDVPSAKGIGHVAGCFAIGFALSVIAYVIVAMHREQTLASSTTELSNPLSQVVHGRILLFTLACVALSVFILIGNALFIAYKVWSF
jgi:hypothetical protein